ncbi:LPS-assembly protein LptD [Litoribacillus peritrichatus]|uniref:LPS-assembly protein LptD n=1 Tax=Litoribacillus peritrichatus TaxID=718191 RepID=A0ABP7LYQ0_9GAMM
MKIRTNHTQPSKRKPAHPWTKKFSALFLSGCATTFSLPSHAQDDGFCSPNQTLTPREFNDILAYADQLGWVKKEDLPEALKAKASDRCDGFYVGRGLQQTLKKDAPIAIEADAAKGSTQANTSQFDGNVTITQEGNQTTSDFACYNKNTNQASLFGNVLIDNSGLKLLGDQAEVNLVEESGSVSNALFAVADAHLRGQSNHMDFDFLDDSQYVELDSGYITFCEPNSNAWKMEAEDIELDFTEGWGEASHIKLKVQDVPVLYIPWMNFPLDDRRKTGFLRPSFELSQGESSLSTPFYLNLAPNYDATITPRYFENRGAMLEAEFRYMNAWSENRLNGGFLNDDKDYPEEDIREITGESTGEDRWSVHFDHLGKINDWKTEVDFNRVSDDDYKGDFDGILTRSVEGTVDQIVKTSWAGENLAFSGQFRSYQITDEDEISSNQYKQMPDLFLTGNWYEFGPWQPSFTVNATYFDRAASNESLSAAEQSVTVSSAFRTSSEMTLNYNKRKSWGYLTPGVTVYNKQYKLNGFDENSFDSEKDLTLPAAHLSGGLFLERPFEFFGNSLTQTLEPQVMYSYIPYQDQGDIPVFDAARADLTFNQLFEPNRFTGGDRIGDTSQVSMGLTSRFIDNNGTQSLVARAGTILYLKDRKIDLTYNHDDVKSNTDNDYDMSNYIAEIRYNPFKAWTYQFDFEWSDRLDQTERSSHALLWRPGNEHVATVRYNEKKDGLAPREEFLEFSGVWQVSPFWRLLHRWEYDLTLDRTSDVLNGFEYNSCCWRTSLVYRRFYTGDAEDRISNGITEQRDEFDSGIFLMIELKGLSGFGGSNDDLLTELIEGINQRTLYDY